MQISDVIAQLRTTDLAASIRFYTALPGFPLAFQYDDFYAGIRAGPQLFISSSSIQRIPRSRSWRATTICTCIS